MSDEKDEDGIPIFMRMGDGTLIDTRTGKRSVSTEINNAFSDQPQSSMVGPKARTAPAIQGVKRRYIDDLPGTAQQTKAIAVIAAYSVFGLADADISHLVKTSVENIEAIRGSEAYARFMGAMLQNIREHDQDKVRKMINKAAENAASKVTSLVNSRDEKVALNASKDILDRAANDGKSFTNGGTMPSGLTIRIVDDRDNPADRVEVEIDG